jgi:hypothetical protein
MQKWEYCILTGVSSDVNNGINTNYPKLRQFTPDGIVDIERFYNRPKGTNERTVVAQMIYKLGEEGWEMIKIDRSISTINITITGESHIWFKRSML